MAQGQESTVGELVREASDQTAQLVRKEVQRQDIEQTREQLGDVKAHVHDAQEQAKAKVADAHQQVRRRPTPLIAGAVVRRR